MKQSKYFKITLTERETEILKLIAMEFTSKEIADQLYISMNTVKYYRKSLIIKLEARNTAGLMCRAFKHSLLVL